MKLMIIGDTHFGEKQNDTKFNQNLVEMFEWAMETAKANKVDKIVHLGDYFHNRNSINVQTINYGVQGAKVLASHYDKENILTILGNHDIYYKDRLDVHSLSIIEPYVTVVDSLTAIDEDGKVLLTPWIIDNEQWDILVDEVVKKKHEFVLGHFEFNGFKMNDYYTMEHGNSHRELKRCKRVFSGHYHSPQTQNNVHYVGTPIPTTMSEANEEHGVHILDTETNELDFYVYDKVKVISIPYTEIELLEELDPENTSVRIEFPDDLEDETIIMEIQEALAERNFDEVKIKYKGNKAKELLESAVDTIEEVENIDLVVKTFIDNSTEVDGIDKSILLKYYNEAIERGEEN